MEEKGRLKKGSKSIFAKMTYTLSCDEVCGDCRGLLGYLPQRAGLLKGGLRAAIITAAFSSCGVANGREARGAAGRGEVERTLRRRLRWPRSTSFRARPLRAWPQARELNSMVISTGSGPPP